MFKIILYTTAHSSIQGYHSNGYTKILFDQKYTKYAMRNKFFMTAYIFHKKHQLISISNSEKYNT